MSIIEYENNAVPVTDLGKWQQQYAYRCDLAIIHEEDGTFSAIVLNLPGAGSCGDTSEEAIENVHEAIAGVILSYKSRGEEIPWKSESDALPSGADWKRILVNA